MILLTKCTNYLGDLPSGVCDFDIKSRVLRKSKG